MTRPHSPTDPAFGQTKSPAPPGHLEVELRITESPASGWSRLWAWLLAPAEKDSADEGADKLASTRPEERRRVLRDLETRVQVDRELVSVSVGLLPVLVDSANSTRLLRCTTSWP